ncbi:Hypothetical predicted protein [Octopus vulgaris]|uniref:Uncharacterized protein n=1 Tax=Octopus vulgaris TaxID=6645 RepID=A0AA36BSM2_OCTVU|nr:Hypothetical predicted protein [Octopus vulgaris]
MTVPCRHSFLPNLNRIKLPTCEYVAAVAVSVGGVGVDAASASCHEVGAGDVGDGEPFHFLQQPIFILRSNQFRK